MESATDRLHAMHASFLAERPPGADEDVHMLSSIVDDVILRYSDPGDTVFDPFAGFGTTLERSVSLGRKAFGVELLPERVQYASARVPDAQIFEGDARELLRVLERSGVNPSEWSADLVLTSPPYMTKNHHDADPLTAYERNDGDYARYLRELDLIAAQCARVISPGGFMVCNVADISHRGLTTHLVGDCTRLLTRHLTHVCTTEIVWDRHPHDLVFDALLVFQNS